MFAFVLVADAVFNVLRGLILSCFDFDFIGAAGLSSFFLVYIPAILIAWGAGVTAQGLYIAQNTPMFALLGKNRIRIVSYTPHQSALCCS